MTWIKICGITNLEDAHAAVAAGANALGFVFFEKSPRRVKVETVKSIVVDLPLKVEKIGVFVNETVEGVERTVTDAGLTAVQLHGEEDAEFSRALFRLMSKGLRRPIIFRSCPAHIFDKPADQSVGWDPVTSGLVEPDEAYKGKRVQKIHVAKNGDLFLETHGFRPGVITGVLLDSYSSTARAGTGKAFDCARLHPSARA